MGTYLIFSKELFCQHITKQIDKAKELINYKILDIQSYNQFKEEFDTWDDYNQELLKRAFEAEKNEYISKYSSIDCGSTRIRIENLLLPNNKKASYNKMKFLERLYNKIDLIPCNSFSEQIKLKPTISSNQIFIVHGHDDSAQLAVARFIEKLKLEPIILHEQPNGGRTIIEKIETFSNVKFGIVLYTPCDLGAVKDQKNNLQPRARQNVIFEHGYLTGKLGRENVCALVKGNIETPNDISGVVYIAMDDKNGWEIKVAKELRNAGYSIDMNLL